MTQMPMATPNDSEIQSLKSERKRLGDIIDRWNTWNIVFIIVGFIAAGGLVVTSIFLRNKNAGLVEVQSSLDAATEAKLARDLGDKEVKIAELNEKAEREKLDRIKLQRQFSNRHIPAANWDKLAKSLSQFSGQAVVIDIFPVNFEHVFLAHEVQGILIKAGWNVLSINQLKTAPDVLVSGAWFQATADPASQAAARAAFDVLSPYTSGVHTPTPLKNSEPPYVWILVGDLPIPVKEAVK